jgi:uncharacterized protein (DUF1330 family)
MIEPRMTPENGCRTFQGRYAVKIGRSAVLATTLAAGVVVGIAIEKTVRAENSPPGYVVAEAKVNDPDGMKPYREGVGATVKQYGGRFIVRGNKIEGVEGNAPDGVVAILEFKSLADAHHWHDSPEYQAIIGIRHKAAMSRVFFVEGVPE